MHDAQLDGRPEVDGFDGFRESLQPIDAGEEVVLYPAVL
jgi:hypothetical protein